MILKNGYIYLKPKKESEEIINSFSLDIKSKYNYLQSPKNKHLTLNYFGEIDEKIINDINLNTNNELVNLINLYKNDSLKILNNIEYFKSNATQEDIFYLGVENNKILTDYFQNKGFSISLPHITILKGFNLTKNQISDILNNHGKINKDLFLDISKSYYSGKK